MGGGGDTISINKYNMDFAVPFRTLHKNIKYFPRVLISLYINTENVSYIFL